VFKPVFSALAQPADVKHFTWKKKIAARPVSLVPEELPAVAVTTVLAALVAVWGYNPLLVAAVNR
jgi:hypothetical protein